MRLLGHVSIYTIEDNFYDFCIHNDSLPVKEGIQ